MSEPEQEVRDRGSVLSVRFSADEIELLRQRAARVGMPVSVFVRRFVTERQRTQLPVGTRAAFNASTDNERSPGLNVKGYSGRYVTSTASNT